MKRLLLVSLLACSSVLSACQREDAKDHISINGKVFIFNIRLARAFYVVTLNRLSGVPDGSIVTAEFENPAGGPVLTKEQKVFPNMTRIDLESPDVLCVVPDKPYAIKIVLKSPEGDVLQTINTTLSSTLDESVLPAQSLVEGPAYDKNKNAFNPNGTTKFRAKCKA